MHNDPRLDLQWPLPVAVISEKDQKFGLLDQIEPELKRRDGRIERSKHPRADEIMIIVDNALKARAEQGKPIKLRSWAPVSWRRG